MPMKVTVIGAAAVFDYIYMVEQLPQRGQIKLIEPAEQQNRVYYCGGGAPNIACVLAKLGLQPNLVYPVGEDFSNSDCEQSWRNLGVDLSGVHVVNGERSGFAYLFFEINGDSMCFAYPGAADTSTVPSISMQGQKVIIGPVYNTFTRQWLEIAIEQECDIILTGISSPRISDYFEYIDTMILNHTEAADMCSTLGLKEPEHLVSRIRGQKLFVTHGASGSMIYSDKQSVQISALKLKRFLDPTGLAMHFRLVLFSECLVISPLTHAGLLDQQQPVLLWSSSAAKLICQHWKISSSV